MQIIPFMIDDARYNVFVALEEKNLERMKAYDPAQFGVEKLPPEWKFLVESGAPAAALEFLSRGFAFRPKLGDTDAPYR